MMKIKKFIQSINDYNLTIQERLFRLLVLIGFTGMTLGIMVGVAIGEDAFNLVSLFIMLVILVLITYLTIRFQRVQAGAVAIAAIVIFIALPFNFLTSGGVYGGASIWFLFGLAYVSLVVEGKIKYVLLVCGFALMIGCYYISYYYPGMIVQHTLEMTYIDSVSTIINVGLLICSMILFQNAIYRSENRVVKNQKKEIEELNQVQNRFFSSMSHEIRTPINTIIGLNEMILREDVSDEVAADARYIQGASKMLLTLINDILDMSKMESGKMDIVPVAYDSGAMLSDIVNMIWVRAKEKGLEFHIDVDPDMPARLLGDEVRIKQILINVLNNAVKYTSEGSVTLSIQCKNTKDGLAQIIYSVTDTGIGIKKESIPYLFSAFKRVDEEKNRYIEGTGLGLSIVKQLVELMDGDIAVNSVYTKGTVFVVTLPQKVAGEEKIGKLDLETRHALNVREHYKQSFEAPEAHVLIVDDNEANLMVVQKLLRETKVQTDTASSGSECLEKTIQNRYEVIFMDHLMPGMDGIECLRGIRTQTGGLNQNTPVVILTANAGGENQKLYKREGFDGYLLKPVSGELLEAELLRHLPRELVSIMNVDDVIGITETPVMGHKNKLSLMISTDSSADLPADLIKRHHIAIIPYRVFTEGGEFIDGIEAETDGLLAYMEGMGKDVRSNGPSVADYEEYFAELLTKAQCVIHIGIAKNASIAYSNALEASKTFDNVIVVESGHLSSGMGLMALRAAEMAEAGSEPSVVADEMVRIKKHVKTSFVVDTTKYLVRSGRLSPRANAVCEALMLHPVIVMKNSSIKVGTVRIGTRDHSWEKYIGSTFHDASNIDKKILFITYVGLTLEELEKVKEQVKNYVEFEHVICQKASPAIATNCGPGTFGLLFMLKNK